MAPDPRKATARYLYTYPTAQLLYQGVVIARKLRPEDVKSQAAGLIPKRAFAFDVFTPTIMIVSIQYAWQLS